MATSSLRISYPASPPPICSPNLMPFHIDYNGPAPVSTYFRVKPAPEAPHTQSCVAESNTPLVDENESNDVFTRRNTLQRVKSRFLATFRGRTVHGLEVALPPGYTGVVLRSDEADQKVAVSRNGKSEVKKKRPVKARTTRGRSTRANNADADEVGDAASLMDLDPEGSMDTEESPAIRLLHLSSTFPSFTLWNPDIPVDEGSDEYLRALTEWIKLAAQIHHVE